MQYKMLKRNFDILLSILILFFLSPIISILYVIVKFSSHGPVFYRGERVGFNGKKFYIYKFRTMVLNSENQINPITADKDPRIINVGRLLRRWKLDELPNFLNVLMGDMSLVGPRPESPDLVKLYSPKQRQVLSVHPGIACLAQIRYPNEQSIFSGKYINKEIYLKHMDEKLILDLLYVQTASFFGDILILICTFLSLCGIQIDLEAFFINHMRNKI